MKKIDNSEHPLVSVLILNWNGEKVIRSCIEAVLNCSYTNYEVIVVDNGSTDTSIKILKEFASDIKLIQIECNLGYAAGNNIGFVHCKGKYITPINNDLIVTRDWLTEPIDILEKYDKVGSISCRQMNYYNRNKIDSLFFTLGTRLFLVNYSKTNWDNIPISIVLAPNGASAIYRKNMLDQIGFFDESYYAYHEECDLGMRAFIAGWKCIYTPNSVVYHMDSLSFNKNSAYKRYLHERNRYLFSAKFFHIRIAIKYLPFLLLGEIKDLIFFSRNKLTIKYYFAARLDAIFMIIKRCAEFKIIHNSLLKRYKEFNNIVRKGFIPIKQEENQLFL